jgi:hypothetical protein
LGVAEADGAGMQIFAAPFFGIRRRPKQGIDQFLQWPFNFDPLGKSFEAMPHRALDSGAGEAGVPGMAFALDRVVDDADRLSSAQMDGTDGVKKNCSVFLKHG